MPLRTSLLALFTAFASVITGARAAPPTPTACFVEWSDAAPVVEREQLTSARSVHDLARRHVLGELVRITLCQDAESFIYRLLVRDGQGRVSTFTVDARRPFVPQ